MIEMINNFIKIMTFACFLLVQEQVYGNTNFESIFPEKTPIIKTASDPYNDWKELTYSISFDNHMMEFIPKDQDVTNWTKLICIQQNKRSAAQRKESLENFLKRVKKELEVSSKPDQLHWNPLLESKNDIMYEWILYSSKNKTVLEHEISRHIFTKNHHYKIGYVQRNEKINEETKQKWIKILKDSVEIVNLEKAKKSIGFTLAKSEKLEIDLGSAFRNWIKTLHRTLIIKSSQNTFLPIAIDDKNIIFQILEVKTIPDSEIHKFDLESLREEKTKVYKLNNTDQTILKKSQEQLIYAFTRPAEEHTQFTITNLFIKKDICYDLTLNMIMREKPSEKEIVKWKTVMEEIKP